jgi:Fe-S-cluster containining protein
MNVEMDEDRNDPFQPPPVLATGPSRPTSTSIGSRRDIHRGLLHVHDRLSSNAVETRHALSLVSALVDLLGRSGLIDPAGLQRSKMATAQRITDRSDEKPLQVVHEELEEADKYSSGGGVMIDCADRIHLCRASCCRLNFALSKQDVQEGIVRWNLEAPYAIAKHPNGYCANLDPGPMGCSVWENRPRTCRQYDCRKDARIWVDFENRIPQPALEREDWPRCLHMSEDLHPPGAGSR